MKRCSQCHFTFSDDEQFCDFDHTELTALREKPSALPKLPKGFHGRFGWFVGSHIGSSLLVLSVIAISAFLGGHFDYIKPLEDVALNSASEDSSRHLGPTSQKKQRKALIEPVAKARKISTQRKLAANDRGSSMPESILKWRPPASHEQRSHARLAQRGPLSKRRAHASVAAKRVAPRNTTHATNKRMAPTYATHATNKRMAPGNVSASKRKPAVVGAKDFQTRNHSSVRAPNSSKRKGSSKLVAFFKKTGSILSKPFRL